MHELHPGWFASVKGTAILAVATYDNPHMPVAASWLTTATGMWGLS